MKTLCNRAIPALVFAGFIGWIIAQANSGSGNVIFETVGAIPYGDKLGHFGLYGMLCLLTCIALGNRKVMIKNHAIQLGALIILSLAIIEEFSQLFLVNRTFDLVDISADIAGILVFTLIFNRISRRKV